MPTFKFTLEDGRTGRVEGADAAEAKANFTRFVLPDMMRRQEDKEPTSEPTQKRPIDPELLKRDLEEDRKKYDPAKDMAWYEKGAVGFQSGLRNAISGAKDLVGLEDDEGRQERVDREERNKPLGNWGKAGTFVGETAATLPFGGGAAGVAGKVLTKAAPLARLAGVGGRFANVGTVGSGAVQGAVQEGLVGKAGDQGDLYKRVGDAAEGGVYGALGGAVPFAAINLPKAVGATWKAGKNIIKPGEEEIKKRSVAALEKTIGKEAIDDARRAMEHAAPPTIPQTSAAMANSPKLAALESGARGRRFADFDSHDENVARTAWDLMKPPPGTGSEAGDAVRQTFMRNGQPLSERSFGEGAMRVPEIQSRPLRKALSDKGPHMNPDEFAMADAIGSDLSKHELHRFAQGATVPDVTKWTDYVPTAVSVLTNKFFPGSGHVAAAGRAIASRARGQVAREMKLSNQDKVMQHIDEALLDPQKFQTMVDDVRALVVAGEPLNKKQQALKMFVDISSDELAASNANVESK